MGERQSINDELYEEFYDPTEHFARESREFCYGLATELIEKANTTKGVLLLFTWNFAALETKKLTIANVGCLIKNARNDLQLLESHTIANADDGIWDCVERVFDAFKIVCGQTGASKALGLLNPHLFVMWDTVIRKRLNRQLIPGIGNGQTGKQFVTFLKGIQAILKKHGVAEKLPGTNVAKKIDEYNYVRIVMKMNPGSDI